MATPFPNRGFLPFTNPVSDWVDPRRNALMGFSAGMLSGNPGGAMTGAMQGSMLDQQYARDQMEFEQEQEAKNATVEWLQSQGYDDLVQMAQATGDIGAAWSEGLKRTNPGAGASAPANVQEWQYYSSLSPEDQSRYLTMKRSNSPLNIGTGFVTQDMANPGQLLGGPIAIENEQAAYDTSFGRVAGQSDAESAALAESVQSKLPGLRTVIDDLTALADTATYTMSGQAMDSLKRELGLPVGQGAIDRASYIAIVDNQVLPLLRDTFGAAFTQKEGESLRATLGDPNKSPAEKKAILNAFITQKERDIAAMQSRASNGNASGVVPASEYFR